MDRPNKEDVSAALARALGPHVGVQDLKVLALEVHALRGELVQAELRHTMDMLELNQLKSAARDLCRTWKQLPGPLVFDAKIEKLCELVK